jgi:superfamily II DNA helicase RecQ
MSNPEIIVTEINRPNLYIECTKRTTVNKFVKSLEIDLLPMIGEFDSGSHKSMGPDFGGSTIIYCQRKDHVKKIVIWLNERGIVAHAYTADMDQDARAIAQRKFMNDEVTIMVATIAFGMGIDKPNIRNIIHYGCPSSIDGYYQEIGRAGRDGLPSRCKLFYSDGDFSLHANRAEKRKAIKRIC